MIVKSKMMFILIGDDKTGKTTLQKILIDKLTLNGYYEKLPTNLLCNITHPEIKRKYKTISFGNRSYQEKKEGYYKTGENYFNEHFADADIAFISSHLIQSDIEEMINNSKQRFFNVIGVFWTNSLADPRNNLISLLDWNERLIIENPILQQDDQIDNQLNSIAENFITFIANRTGIS